MKTETVLEGWECKNIGSFISENKKSSVQVQDANDFDEYLFFTSGEKILRYKDWLIDGENIFMSTGGVANVQYHEGKCSYSTDTYCFKSKIDTKFLYYYLLNIISKINYSYFQGTGLKHLQKPMLKDHEFLFPEKPKEREKIAEILSTVDNAINKTNELIEKNIRIKTGLISDLFSKGITLQLNFHEKFKETKLGKIPDDWDIDHIKSSCDIVDYRGRAPPKVDRGIFLVTSRNIKNGIIDYSLAQEYVPEEEYGLIMGRGFPKKGDVLITTEAPFGEIASVDIEKIALAQRIIKLRGKSKLDNYYLKIFLETEIFQKQLRAEATGSTVQGIKGSRLVKLNLLIPKDINEQKRIFSVVESSDLKIQSEQNHLNKLIKIKKGLMQDLLTGKTRVKV